MTQYEALVDHAESRGIQVIKFDFTSELKGLCIGNYIGIKKRPPRRRKARHPLRRARPRPDQLRQHPRPTQPK